MSPHLIILQVVLPLLCAPLIVLLRSARLAWLLSLAVSWGTLLIAGALWWQVDQSGPMSYAVGNWPAPWGIEVRVDRLSSFVLLLIGLSAALVAPYARISVAAELPGDQVYLLYSMYCLCLAGLLGMTVTGDAFNLFVFLEISSLSTYVMIALGRRRRALLAAYQYLLMGTVGATFYVIGVGLLYLMTGTLNLMDMAARLGEVRELRPVITALAFITVGMGLKLALFPLHQWLPNAYASAPSAVSAFLAATATKVSIYVLLRFWFSVFGAQAVFTRLPVAEVLVVLSLAAIVVASGVALFQQDLKRLFAWSSVAQIGYITLGIGLANIQGLSAAIVHLFNHGLMKGAIFLALGAVALRCGGVTTFEQVAGLGRRMPLAATTVLLGGLSLIGVPGTTGFITKWQLVQGALAGGQPWLAAMIVATSLIAVGYVWRFVEAAWLRPPTALSAPPGEAPASMTWMALLAGAACVYFGFDTTFTLDAATAAARALLEYQP
ncbi:MAG: monovalent cation/H+ antiporter subunit D family protein [Betaproteobacteria bacterium]|nr:monovalent cation/H+ antiporter subunit D family protein [Betaproteobacteria bacterium]